MAKRVSPFTLDGLLIKPVTLEVWLDLERLFGKHGAYGGCWCMYWRVPHKEFEIRTGEQNRRDLKKRTKRGEVPGIIGFREGEPVAWCSVAPREQFPALELSRVMKRVDARPVWSIVCFYIPRALRGQGLLPALTRAAVEYARRAGARIVEAYPFEPKTKRAPSYMGSLSAFARAGFREVLRRVPTRPVMRYYVT